MDEILYEKLRLWRQVIARKNNFESYKVLQNKTLVEIASKKPSDESKLYSIKGVGPKKIELYGKELLNMVLEHEKNPLDASKTLSKPNELEASVLRVRLEGRKSTNSFQSIWLENDKGRFVLLLLGENINRFKKDDRLQIRGYMCTQSGPPAFLKLLKGGEIKIIKSLKHIKKYDISYVHYTDEDIVNIFTQKFSKIVKHGKLNYIRLKGMLTMPKSETDMRYTIYHLKQDGAYILQVSNGFQKHHFKSYDLANLEEVAENEDKLYEIVYSGRT